MDTVSPKCGFLWAVGFPSLHDVPPQKHSSLSHGTRGVEQIRDSNTFEHSNRLSLAPSTQGFWPCQVKVSTNNHSFSTSTPQRCSGFSTSSGQRRRATNAPLHLGQQLVIGRVEGVARAEERRDVQHRAWAEAERPVPGCLGAGRVMGGSPPWNERGWLSLSEGGGKRVCKCVGCDPFALVPSKKVTMKVDGTTPLGGGKTPSFRGQDMWMSSCGLRNYGKPKSCWSSMWGFGPTIVLRLHD